MQSMLIRVTLCLTFLAAACSSSTPAGDGGGASGDSQLAGDAAHRDGGGASGDGAVTDPEGGTPGVHSLLQVVVNSITLPRSEEEFAADLDGTGNKNQLGRWLAEFQGYGFDGLVPFQANLDGRLEDGRLTLLLEVLGKELANDPAVKVRFRSGNDSDMNAKDNFSGTEPFSFSSLTPNPDFDGAITTQQLSVKSPAGQYKAHLPVGDSPPLVTVKALRIKAKVAPNGMTEGQINVAIGESDLISWLAIGLADEINQTYQSLSDSDSNYQTLQDWFDGWHDGTIDSGDVSGSLKFSFIYQPDVDTDGDKTPDAMSFGFGFTAVPCIIQP